MSTSGRPPTLKDVAALAGVSKSLVSLVIHDSPKVSESSRQRIEAAIDELGYRPNAMARSLAGGASHLLGIVVDCQNDRRWTATVRAARARAAQLDYTPLMACCDEAGSQLTVAEQLLGLRVDALVFAGCSMDAPSLDELTERVPVAVVGSPIESEAADVLVADAGHGADIAVDYLASLGHEQIVYLSDGGRPVDAARTDRYVMGMKTRGLTPQVIPAGNTERSGADAMMGLLQAPPPRPTAVIVADERAAVGALLTAQSRLDIPTSLSILAFDDYGTGQQTGLDLTTVAAPAVDLGMRSVELVLRRVRSDHEPTIAVLEPAILAGSTTGPVPVPAVRATVLL